MLKKEPLNEQYFLGHITLDNPEKRNAFDDVLIKQLSEAFDEAEQDNRIRSVILSAQGPFFSAGADLNWMKKTATYSEDKNIEDAMNLASLMKKVNTLSKPTIALIQGNVYGGALGLIACCDIALASPGVMFCFSETALGLIPAVISPYVLAAIGERNARRYFLTAESFDTQEALRIQLIHCISDNLWADGLALAKKIVKNSPQAISHIKRLVHEIAQHPIDATIIEKTAKAIAQARASADGREGINAFLEKRSPRWGYPE